jgi:hypothetical protein
LAAAVVLGASSARAADSFVRNGVNVMPRFRKTGISDADLKAPGACLARSRP